MSRNNNTKPESEGQGDANVPNWAPRAPASGRPDGWFEEFEEPSERPWSPPSWVAHLARGWVPEHQAAAVLVRTLLQRDVTGEISTLKERGAWPIDPSREKRAAQLEVMRTVRVLYGTTQRQAYLLSRRGLQSAAVTPIDGRFSICAQLPHFPGLSLVAVAEREAEQDEWNESRCGCKGTCDCHERNKWLRGLYPICLSPACVQVCCDPPSVYWCGCEGECIHHWVPPKFYPVCLSPLCAGPRWTHRRCMEHCFWWAKILCKGDHDDITAKRKPCGLPHCSRCWSEFRLDLHIGVNDDHNPGHEPVMGYLGRGGVVVAIVRIGSLARARLDPEGEYKRLATQAHEAAHRFARRSGAFFRADCARPSFHGDELHFVTYVACPAGTSSGRTAGAEVVATTGSANALLDTVEALAGNDWAPFMPTIADADALITGTRRFHKYAAYRGFRGALKQVKRRMVCDLCDNPAVYGMFVRRGDEYVAARKRRDGKRYWVVLCYEHAQEIVDSEA